MELYFKNSKNKFVPFNINSVIGKELENKLVIIRVGSDEMPASIEDIEETAKSFSKAEVLDSLENVSIVLTPYQIDVGVVSQQELEDKDIYIQIRGGDNISFLEDCVKSMYKKMGSKFSVKVLPTPLTVGEYKSVKDIIKRCEIRRSRKK